MASGLLVRLCDEVFVYPRITGSPCNNKRNCASRQLEFHARPKMHSSKVSKQGLATEESSICSTLRVRPSISPHPDPLPQGEVRGEGRNRAQPIPRSNQ